MTTIVPIRKRVGTIVVQYKKKGTNVPSLLVFSIQLIYIDKEGLLQKYSRKADR